MRSRLIRLLNILQKPDVWPLAARRLMLRAMGARVGEGAMVLANVDIFPGPLTLGPASFVNRDCSFDATGGLVLGTRVHLAQGVRLLTSTHAIGPPNCRAGEWRTAAVTIADGVWIGAGTIVLPGVTIARGCMVAAGSVVTADTKPDALYAGVPAVWKKALPTASPTASASARIAALADVAQG